MNAGGEKLAGLYRKDLDSLRMASFPLILFLLAATPPSHAAETTFEQEPVIITATRISEDVAQVPASVTVIGGDELRNRGAYDLRSALSLAAGVDIAPGGDPGPGASIPEFWGLKEFDAYLLVVDGVPWGGAFNPALATLDLRDVERIEVMRGAAPVMYGATSFVGVVHVIHKDPAKSSREIHAYTGSWGSRGGGATIPLDPIGKLHSVVSADIEKQGFRDPKTTSSRDHAHWRGQMDTPPGLLKLNADASLVQSHPSSPVLVSGGGLSSQIPLDANQNLADAFINEDRYTASVGLDHSFSQGQWSTLASYSHSAQGILRGFLTDITKNPDAHGFRENINMTDLYFDSHVQWDPREGWKFVGGIDHIHGRGYARGGDFDYFVDPSGSAAPTGAMQPSQADVRITDQRDFSGLYGFTEWEPHPRWVLEAGMRLNHTEETRRTTNLDLNALTVTTGADEHHTWRPSGSTGATFRAWSRDRDLVNLFASYKNTFKPSAVDFGLDTPAQILNPETAQSYEAGAKSRWFDDHLDFNASFFQMDFKNLVLTNTINGNPTLTNSGSSRFRGVELEGAWHPLDALTWAAAYSLHDARFRQSVQDVGGVPTDVSKLRLPLSARNMYASSLTYAPKQGFIAHTQVNYVGSRFLDPTNIARAKPYAVFSAGGGWRHGGWEVRLEGKNITDQRPPVSASEMGDSQVYLLPARQVELSTSWNF